jgi:O-methyltransferase involved in polyketide biosynthesis
LIRARTGSICRLHYVGVEVDLPEIVEPKRDLLSGEKPHCQLDIIELHLADEGDRRKLFSELNQSSRSVPVMSDGLLAYLEPCSPPACTPRRISAIGWRR